MIDAFFAAFGNIFATGVGILLLAALTAAIVVLWDWRVALLGAVLIHFGSSSILVLIHNVPGMVAGGQMLAVGLSAAMLLLAGLLHPQPMSLRQAGNWPLRAVALVLIAAAWWYLDPGYALPGFSQPETDFLLWTGLCALALLSFSGSPLMGGAAILLWSTPLYALGAVLLPGSGLPAIVGIADIVLALACSYLVLLEPAARRAPQGADLTLRRLPAPRAAARPPETAPAPLPANGTQAAQPLKETAAP